MTQTKQHEQDVDVWVGKRFPLTIRRLGVNGHGIGYYKHKVCFVPGALPNEVVVAEVTRVLPRYLEAKIHRIRKKSRDRVTPRDEYADIAGGFELENLAYQQQLKFKRQVIIDSLEKFQPYGYRNYDVRPTIAAPEEYQPNSHTLVDMETCAVQMPRTMETVRAVTKMIEDLQIPVYDEKHNSGIIKTLAVRESWSTGEVQLTFITNSAKLPHKRELLERIEKELPAVVSVMQNVNPGDTPLVWGDKMIHLAGKDSILESLMGLDFKLSARSFLQLNPEQTEVLYEEASKALELDQDDTLIDAYAGIGTIGLSLASRVKAVRGMEIIPEAVADANENAKLNNITNAKYEVGKAEEVLPRWQKEGLNFDALVVDPPRTGLDDQLIKQILKVKPRKFAYVSCGMASLARNLRRLTSVYHVDYIQPIDMMPQTARCEAVVKLSLRNGNKE